MAVRRLNAITTNAPERDQPYSTSPEQEQSTLGRFATRAYRGAKGLPGDIAKLASSAVNPKIDESTEVGQSISGLQAILGPSLGAQTLEKISSYLPTSSELNKDMAPAQSLPQQIADDFADGLVLTLLTSGGGLLKSGAKGAAKGLAGIFGRSAAGTVGAETAKEMGLGDISQLLSRVGGEFGFDLMKGGAFPGLFKRNLKKKGEEFFEAGNAVAKDINFNATALEKDLESSIKRIENNNTFLKSTEGTELLNEAKSLKSKIFDANAPIAEAPKAAPESLVWMPPEHPVLKAEKEATKAAKAPKPKPEINLADVVQYKRRLNNFIGRAGSKESKDYMKGMVKDAKDSVITPATLQHPKFGDLYNKSESIWKAQNVPGTIGKLVEDEKFQKAITSTTAKAVFTSALGLGTGTAAYLGGPAAALVGTGAVAGGALGLRTVMRAFDMFKGSPEARKMFWDIVDAAEAGQMQLATQKAIKFNHKAEQYDKKRDRKDANIAPGSRKIRRLN